MTNQTYYVACVLLNFGNTLKNLHSVSANIKYCVIFFYDAKKEKITDTYYQVSVQLIQKITLLPQSVTSIYFSDMVGPKDLLASAGHRHTSMAKASVLGQ